MDFECDDNIIIDKALKVLNIDYISHSNTFYWFTV